MIPTRDSYSMTEVSIAGPVNAAEEQSSTCSPTDNSHTPSSKVVSSQSEIPNTLSTTYRITAGEQETCCYSIPTQNPFYPLLNTEQEKAATAEMNQTEGTNSHTPVDTTHRRHRQENAEKSKDNIPKLSPKDNEHTRFRYPLPPLEIVLLHHPAITSLHYLHLKENVHLPFSISSL